MSVWRAAVIGCGLIGSEFGADRPAGEGFGIYTHAGAYRACQRTELAAVCDADAQRVRRAGQRWRVEACYTDPRRLLSEARPQLVSICTPDATHYELVRLALTAEGVRAVLAEKPLATSIEEAEELVRIAAERGVLLAVNYSRRFAPRYVRLREQLAGDAFGPVRLVRSLYGKGTLHNGSHAFDLLRYLIGEPAAITATDRLKENGADPTLDVRLEFAGGARAELLAVAPGDYTVFELDLLTARGRIRLLQGGDSVEVYEAREGIPYPGYRGLVLRENTAGALKDVLLHAVEDVVESLEHGRAPWCTGADGVAALRIGMAARVAGLPNAKR